MDYNAYVNIDSNKLASLGFSREEIQAVNYVYVNGGKFTPSALQQYGYTPQQAKRMAYAYNICSGKVSVGSKEEVGKHLKKMFGSNYKISMHDLAISKVTTVPRVAIVGGIIDKPYDIYNSNQYQGKGKFYRVTDVTGQRITVETSRKPQLQYKQAKEIPGVLEIRGLTANNNAVVTFDKKYCKLCNRFIIVASFRMPEYHHGMYEIMCFEGTKIYVYAMSLGVKEKVSYSSNNQRIYDFGLFPNEIKSKLDNSTKVLYSHLNGVGLQYHQPTQKYDIITREREVNNIDEDGALL